MFLQSLFLLFLDSFVSLVHGQYNATSPCINVGDCYPDVVPDSKLVGISIFGWDECTTAGNSSLNQKAWINGGFNDTNTMININGTYQNIPWNSAAANDFFGPEDKLDSTIRKQIQNVFASVQATYKGGSGNSFPHQIHVKCGGKSTMCYKTDPCNKNGPKIHSGVEAYIDQKDENGYPQITFCPPYFALPTLNNSITSGLAKSDPMDRFNLESYENRARSFFHAITHLVSLTNTSTQGTNNHIWDWKVTIKTNGSSTMTADTYGSLWTKILARYNPKSKPYGTFSSRNADNYAQYALARYVQTKLGEYPHYPSLVKNKKPTKIPALREWIASTYDDTNGTNPIFDNDVLNNFLNASFAYPGCADDTLGLNSTDNSVTIDTFFQDSDYPAEYIVQRNAWMANAYRFPPLVNKTLRILPLGASITNGYRSTDGDGYRKQVLLDLSQSNATMIGGLLSGTMANNNNDGYIGDTINKIAANPHTASALAELPNVVLLHAGTNDMYSHQNASDAPAQLGKLIDQILAASPNATVFVALILPSKNKAVQANIINFNAVLPAVVGARASPHRRVFLVDMYSQLDLSTDFADNVHPNDAGYVKMGNTWVAAINYAYYELGWLSPVTGIPVCQSLPTWLPQGQVANGAGLGRNIWPATNCTNNTTYVKSDPKPLTTSTKPSKLKSTETPAKPTIYRDLIQSRAISPSTCNADSAPASTAVHLADLNGDGRADYLWVDAQGATTAFLNMGGADGGAESTQISWKPQGVVASGFGGSREQVQFADLNGDGRAEFLLVHGNGSVEAWLNVGGVGLNATRISWVYQGMVADGIGKDGAGVRFADLNGDGRAEYLWVDLDGAVTAYLNLGGPYDGQDAAKVSWLPQGVIATGVGATRENIVFADMNGDGRAEYLVVSRTNGSVQEWYNQGGPNDGPGAANITWSKRGTIASGFGTNGTDVIFADLNGDKRAEYIDIDPNTSALKAWLNIC